MGIIKNFDESMIKSEEEIFDIHFSDANNLKELRERRTNEFKFVSWSETYEYREINFTLKLIIPCILNMSTLEVEYQGKNCINMHVIGEIEDEIPEHIIKIHDEFNDDYLLAVNSSYMVQSLSDKFEYAQQEMINKIDYLFDKLIPDINDTIKIYEDYKVQLNEFYEGKKNV